MDGWIDGSIAIDWLGLLTCIRDHGHAHGSRRSELTDYLGETLVGTLEQHRQTLAVG